MSRRLRSLLTLRIRLALLRLGSHRQLVPTQCRSNRKPLLALDTKHTGSPTPELRPQLDATRRPKELPIRRRNGVRFPRRCRRRVESSRSHPTQKPERDRLPLRLHRYGRSQQLNVHRRPTAKYRAQIHPEPPRQQDPPQPESRLNRPSRTPEQARHPNHQSHTLASSQRSDRHLQRWKQNDQSGVSSSAQLAHRQVRPSPSHPNRKPVHDLSSSNR